MAGSVNKVILIGNLGADPDIRQTKDGRDIANLSIATSKTWKDRTTGEKREKTEWHRVVIFSEGLCSIVKRYLKKGSTVYIEGELQTRKWQDQQGMDKYTTEIILQGFNATLTMLSKSKNDPGYQPDDEAGANYQQQTHQPTSNNAPTPDLDDDIPF